MPTGYTSPLYDNEPITFPEFIMRCARATGAYILMRDEPLNAPDPGDWKPQTSYHEETLKKAKATLADAEKWTPEEAAAKAREDYETSYASWLERERNRAELQGRYEYMLGQVRGWKPPTEDHEGLKKFMVEQLEESIRFDCSSWEPPTLKSGTEHQAAVIARARRDIEYHTAEIKEEKERTASRNAWTKALRDDVAQLV